MASFLYDEGRKMLGGIGTHTTQINFDTAALAVFFVDEADDTISQTADVDAADRTAAAQVPDFASAPTIANNVSTIDSSVLKVTGDNTLFTALDDDPVESYDIFVDSGTDTTSGLISNHDDATGLPLDPSGGNVTIVWAATGIWRF